MAFIDRNLSVLAYANSFTLWHYKIESDVQTDIDSANYFAEAKFNSGDMLLVSGNKGGRMLCVVKNGEQISTVSLV